MRKTCSVSVLLVILVLWTASLSADEVILKDGRKFTGEILKDTDDEVSIKTVGGILTFTRDEVLRVVWKADPRKEYKLKLKTLSNKAVNGRLELARWCLACGLKKEARREVEQVLALEAENADAQNLLERLTGDAGKAGSLRVEVTLTDGSQVKGRLVNSLFTLETAYGVLRIPTKTVASIVIGDDKTPDAVETRKFKAKGRFTEELFVVDSKLGRLTIARKDVRELAIYQPTRAEVAEAKRNDAMRYYNHFGLDVILVIDCTDSMTGVLLRLRQQSEKLCSVIRKLVPNTHFGLVSYRDHKRFDPNEFTYVTQLSPLTRKVGEFRDSLRKLRAVGGGDIPEAVFEGISQAMIRGGWRLGSRRVIILIGDAPPHPEQNGLRKILRLVGDWRKNAQGTVHAMDTTGYNRMMDQFQNIAKAGGGKAVVLNDETKIARELVPLILGVEWRDYFLKAFDATATPVPE